MQYTTEILIEKSISEVIKKFNSIDNLKHWQNGLESAEHISGIPYQLGAKTRLNYNFGKRKMEIIETITMQDFPNKFHVNYTAQGIRNIQENYFEATGPNTTKWISTNECQPTSFKMSLMLFLIPSAFKKQTETYMDNFKKFIEQGFSVYHSH
ncbi:SRPBCC family protein [Winogradskyella sp. PC D3.3]